MPDDAYEQELSKALQHLGELLIARDTPGVILIFSELPVKNRELKIESIGTHDSRVSQALVIIAASHYSTAVNRVVDQALADVNWGMEGNNPFGTN